METRIKCDASRAGLGAALEQRSPTGWHTVAFASRFLNSNEERYSINELELLGVEWSVEYFKYYLFGKSFTIITDHRALLSIMKEHRSNKSYNSRLTRWIDRLLPFDFNIEHIPGAKMGLVDYISRQPNQKAKVTNKYDEEFAVATITRMRDAIAAIYVNTTPQTCQSQHFNSVINTHSTRASHPRSTNYSNLLSAINRNTNQLLLKYSAHAAQLQTHSNTSTNPTQIQPQLNTKSNQIHIHVIENHKMSSSPSHSRNPQTPPTHSRVTFQSTPNSGTTRSSNDGHPSPSVDLSKEEVFENNLTQLFTKGFLAVLTSKDAVLKEVRDCILQDDPQRCKEVNPSLFSYWRYLHVRSGCVCVDERVAIPHAIQDAVLESLHLTHPGSWGMITLGQYAFWPYMHREILNKAATCKPCTDIGKNLKPVIPASKWKPLLPCTEPNEEIQIDFGGPITNEKDQDIYFLACIDRFSKYPSVEVFDEANGPNVLKFLDDYIQIHGVPRNIRLDQARCLIGYKVKNFCKQHNINILPAPVNDHRAIGLVERLIQTIKRRLGCMKLDNRNKTFTIKEAIKSIVYQLRICKQKTTRVTPFQAHLRRKPNTPLSNKSTTPKSSNLSYENILHHYLDADTVPVEDYLDDNGWVTRDRSDILIEEAMQRAQVDAGRRYNGEHNKSVSRFVLHPKLNNPIPRSEQSLDLKLARKVTKRSKRDLRGLWETLAPGSTVVRTLDTTTVIKEPGVPEVSVRNSDIAKFGTRAERNSNLWQYAQRRPLPYEKTTEEKIAQYTKDLKKKFRGEIKIRHRPTQSDAASGVSSANSNISKAMSARKPRKPQAGGKRSRHTSVSLNTSNASSVAAPSVTSSITSPSTTSTKRNRRAPEYYGFENSVNSVSDDSTAPVSKKPKRTNPVIETILQEEATQPPVPDTDYELTIASPSAPPPVGTWSPEEYNYEDYAREVSMSVFDAENQI